MQFSLLSLNLHGYHPMGEPRRFLEDPDGRIRPAGSYPSGESLYYFTTDELDHGHRRRLDRLGHDLVRVAPDIVCLQEVAAGSPWTARNQEVFLHDYPDDWFEANSALRLVRRLNNLESEGRKWQPVLACRGNVGWHTGPGVFAHGRVVAFSGSHKQVIYDFDANPYPEGLLVEGFAVLVREPWQLVDHQEWNLVHNSRGHKVFVQAVMLRHGGGPTETAPWLVLANVHLGHKVTHFEQAIALRSALLDYRRQFTGSGHCLGMVIAGDYNAVRYRPHDGVHDAAMIPWEIHVPGQFDFRPQAEAHGELLSALWALNDDQSYKPWATIHDPTEARHRIREAAEKFAVLQSETPADWPALLDGLSVAVENKRIRQCPDVSTAASIPQRIDFVFAESTLPVADACVVFPENTFASNTGTSDHPAILAAYEI
jgi:hypothetical protein